MTTRSKSASDPPVPDPHLLSLLPASAVDLNDRAVRDLEIGSLRPALQKLQLAARQVDSWMSQWWTTLHLTAARSERPQQCHSPFEMSWSCTPVASLTSTGTGRREVSPGGGDLFPTYTCCFQPSREGFWPEWECPVRIVTAHTWNGRTEKVEAPTSTELSRMSLWEQRVACAVILHNLALAYRFWHRMDSGASLRRDADTVLLSGALFVLQRSHDVLGSAHACADRWDQRFVTVDLSRRILASASAVLADLGRVEEAFLVKSLLAAPGGARITDSDVPELNASHAKADIEIQGVAPDAAAAAAA